ncbi:glutathione S-transferase N-terminal domain-containing protein [Kordiimonas gwangyangensis]|uniref:glutathione S-transferase N-terminal domain-containing protein n=1 Tax=Kordiimonas gwangyangensis TaxID=288022 RepID=UPI000688C0B0|nr:glutathione S-transferase N-terminal domain-containing protein [Kordiimonas gwangyangensis]
MRQLYELCGENRDVRFSPYCWRTRLMLQHKGLEFDPVAITFLEKQPLESAGSRTVPVLNDNGTWVKDSFDIALYLDDTYTDKPLFGNATARAQAVVLNDWLNRTLVLGIFPMIVADLHGHLDAKNAAYFRETREKFLGCTLEDAQAPALKSSRLSARRLRRFGLLSSRTTGLRAMRPAGSTMPPSVLSSGRTSPATLTFWTRMTAFTHGASACSTSLTAQPAPCLGLYREIACAGLATVPIWVYQAEQRVPARIR